MIKTKIIATLGPASTDAETLEALIDNGVDVFRMNFSHGTLEEHAQLLETLNAVRAQHRHTTAILGDLCGPKIRIGNICPDGDVLEQGDTVTILADTVTGTKARFSSNYPGLIQDVHVGHRIFIDDGQIALRVQAKDDKELNCVVTMGGPLCSHKGINLPDSNLDVPSITDYDWQCVDWAIEHELDFLALSFVRSAQEIEQLRQYIRQANTDIRIIAKLETPQALRDLEAIIKACDAALVARGDLGVEMDLAEVPILQKRITRMCRDLGKPVVVATQMLQSMIEHPTATRAEVSDIANAVMDFSDAVMLSGETAVGKYPLPAAQTIQRIAQVTEDYLGQNSSLHPRSTTSDDLALTASMSRSVGYIADDIKAKLVAVWSQSGSSAQLLSKARIDVPILALSSDPRICRQMCLGYGVIPRCRPIPTDIEAFARMVDKVILGRQWAQVGDRIILVTGQPIGVSGSTNAIVVHSIADLSSATATNASEQDSVLVCP